MEIVNLSELDPAWNWLKRGFESIDPGLNWHHASTQNAEVPDWLPRRRTLQRLEAARNARAMAKGADSVLVSHGPRMTAFGSLASGLRSPFAHHVAYSFNYTTLPVGLEHRLMRRSFRQVDKFVVFSNMERTLYSDYFEIDAAKFDMIHWAVNPPRFDPARAPLVTGRYICALGSQGRDYGTLLSAMTRLPAIRLVIIGTRQSLAGLTVPDNVQVCTDVPIADAHNVLAKSSLMVLPLAGSRVPCGHVTLVSAMHLGIPIVATDSIGISDYVTHDVTGRVTPAREPLALANEIEALFSSAEQCQALGDNGRTFAATHCEEKHVVDYFAALVRSYREGAGR